MPLNKETEPETATHSDKKFLVYRNIGSKVDDRVVWETGRYQAPLTLCLRYLNYIHFEAKRLGHHEKTQKFGVIHSFLSKIHIFINIFINKIIY